MFVEGEVITSRRGELSVMADGWAMAAKALRPLPIVHSELSEETRVRQRYVDLDRAAAGARDGAHAAPQVGADPSLDALHDRGFLEVETPMLQLLHGGATARPFVTHANAFDTDLYLRIAPELFLKRAVVGGIERVFEINRNFRNEGIDSTHSPEFAMLEAYQAYGAYDDMAELTHDLVIRMRTCRVRIRRPFVMPTGPNTTWGASGVRSRCTPPYRKRWIVNVTVDTPARGPAQARRRVDVEIDESWSAGKLVLELFEKLVEHTLIAPTFVRDYPVETRPLTRAAPRRSAPGREVGPDRARHRARDRVLRARRPGDPARALASRRRCCAAAGDPEAMQLDEDFLRAMEYGMPPTGGMGMGIDRLLMALTGLGIRETILYPLVRNE